MRRITPLALVALRIACSGPALGAVEPPSPGTHEPWRVHVVVSDRFGFSPDFLAAIGDDALAILRAAGIDATWSPEEQVHAEAGDHQWQVNGAGSFLVLFSGKAPSAWGVKRRAMGIVVAEPHPRRHVIVSR